MCLTFRIIATFAIVAGTACLVLGASPKPQAPADPLLPLLQDDDPRASAKVLDEIRERGGSPCLALRGYATHPNSRVRGNAVQAMDDAGCAEFQAYEGYIRDTSAIVLSGLVEASGRHMIREAVPFLLGSLTDRRRIVSEAGTYSIGEAAERALMLITCQSFHFDAAASRDYQRNAVTRWRQWYQAKRDRPRDEWVKEGIDRGRDYATGDIASHRVEGLRLLALIGPQALPALREVLARQSGDLHAEILCEPEEPPRINDVVPCTLVVRNVSKRPLAIAPPSDGPEVRISRSDAPAEGSLPPVARPGDVDVKARLGDFADRVLDLPAGDVRKFEFPVGPVLTAGRYRVRATLVDLASELASRPASPDETGGKRPGAGSRPAPPSFIIEAETVVRFEQ